MHKGPSSVPPIHHPAFNVDKTVMEHGVNLLARVIQHKLAIS